MLPCIRKLRKEITQLRKEFNWFKFKTTEDIKKLEIENLILKYDLKKEKTSSFYKDNILKYKWYTIWQVTNSILDLKREIKRIDEVEENVLWEDEKWTIVPCSDNQKPCCKKHIKEIQEMINKYKTN